MNARISRQLLVAPLLAAALLGAGCGGSDADKVKNVTNDFFNALKDGDGGKACDALAADTAKQAVTDGKSCEENITAAVKQAGADQFKGAKISISNVKVTGKTATAHVVTSSDKNPKEENDFKYAKEGGDWKVVSFQ
ncbi:MAG: hypothetical protein QOF76_1922 [Solirubrobacteraceae bacterium]|jgi:hypothetical protein|nr:hypothetical protein [Solirubrobacteraceae bacterium]